MSRPDTFATVVSSGALILISIKQKHEELDMDFASATNGSSGGGFAGFIPLLIMGCFFGGIFHSIAKRKGRNQWLWFIAGFVPLWNILGVIWLASLPDKSIIEEVSSLVTELQNFNYTPKE